MVSHRVVAAAVIEPLLVMFNIKAVPPSQDFEGKFSCQEVTRSHKYLGVLGSWNKSLLELERFARSSISYR